MPKKIKDETLIEALLTTTTQRNAAAKLGIAEKTICARKHDPEFMRKYDEARQARILEVRDTLQMTAKNAAITLNDVMIDRGTPASVRVSAASEVLRQSARYTELGDVLERLKALEDKANAD